MLKTIGKMNVKALWVVAIIFGTSSRVLIALLGHNEDFYNWTWNATEMRNGGSVYSGNVPYGYGPVWMFILKFADLIQAIFPDNRKIFRLVIILILTLVDYLIARFIAKQFSNTAAILFFINPISIIITGYHNQFDNLALLVSLYAIVLLGINDFKNSQKSVIYGLIAIGLSLAVKQVVLFLPIWLFFRAGTLRQKISRVVIPFGIYVACFIPWATSRSRIEIIFEEVFLQRRGRSGILFNLAGADYAGTIQGASYSDLVRKIVFVVWVVGILAFGWIMRNKPLIHSLIVYMVVMVAFAPAYSQQQLILPLIAVFVYATIELKIFYLLTLLFMIQNSDELGIEFFFPYFFRLNGTIYAWLQVLLLIFSLRIILKKNSTNFESSHLSSVLGLK